MNRIKKLLAFTLSILVVSSIFIADCSLVFAASVKAPKLASVTPKTSNSITINWKKVSGVSGYVIYQKKGSGDFEKIKVISNAKTTSYTQKSLSPAVKYTYYIRSYKKSKSGKNIYSSKSNAIYTYTKPATPKITSITSPSKTTIKLKWSKVSRADGYVIYRKSGNDYKRLSTVSAKTTSYTVKKLTSGKKYYFVVRAYKNVNGKKVYGAISKLASTYTAHTHKYTKKITKPTCTKKGYTTLTCFCGKTKKSNYTSPQHSFVDYVCKKCGEIDTDNAYEYLKSWVLENGEVRGSYVHCDIGNNYYLSYSASADYLYIDYGYYNKYDDFSYDSLNLNDYSFFSNVGDPDYITLDYIEGTINPKTFTEKTPLAISKYNSTYYTHSSLVESARLTFCDMLITLELFLEENEIGITIADLGFEKF